jgi:hypothetical protein
MANKITKIESAYIETNDVGKPCMSLSVLASEVAFTAGFGALESHYPGVTKRPAKGRRKVRIVVTIEDDNC